MNTDSELSRLKQAHDQAICDVNSQVEHWKKVKSDYSHLSNLLTSLPDKTFHKVMVPFGPLAFMPGKIIHTNELLVHLGDSWFADISCKEGLKIIEHRQQAIDKNLEDLDKVVKNIKKKTEFANDLQLNDEDEPAFEIKEEVPVDYLHPGKRKRISRVKNQSSNVNRQKPPKESNSDDGAVKSCFDDDELMKRLDELERKEEEEDQMLLNVSDQTLNGKSEIAANETSEVASLKKVSWSEKIREGREADSDDSDDFVASCATIRFSHTPSFPIKQDLDEHASGELIDAAVRTPGDIGRGVFQAVSASDRVVNDAKSQTSIRTKETLKSILKPSSTSNQETLHPVKPEKSALLKHQIAVSATVLERDSKLPVKPEEKAMSKKPISKFKVSRKR